MLQEAFKKLDMDNYDDEDEGTVRDGASRVPGPTFSPPSPLARNQHLPLTNNASPRRLPPPEYSAINRSRYSRTTGKTPTSLSRTATMSRRRGTT